MDGTRNEHSERVEPVFGEMRYLAHKSETDGREQSVAEHLEGTAELCGGFAAAFGMEAQGRFTALAHDIGKCTDAFQERLRGGRIVDHASAGALECAKQNALWAACCVAGHHGGLPDVGNLRNDGPDEPTLVGRLKRFQNAIQGGTKAPVPPIPLPQVPPPSGFGRDALRDSFTTRMLFSCLVDADFLDTERFMSNGTVERGMGENLPTLLEKLERHIAPWLTPKTDLNRRRCEVLRACLDGDRLERGLYTLTVPTGGGKTVASMAFALRHAVRHGMDRVIYVIPYTSIIEQTADVFRDIFGAENVLEHHSNAVIEVGEQDDAEKYRQLRATENWDAPIVVTTAVQFFESMYSNRTSKCRKLHSIANSVVIFDEAQTLPREHLRPCVAAISALVSQFRATATLCTATQPALNDLFAKYAPGVTIRELCPDPVALFAALRRVRFEQLGVTDAERLTEGLAVLPQVLCIVNSRNAAQEVYAGLPRDGSFHLSTLMYPAHRRKVIAEIRQRLKKGLPCRVVSTSLMEAGVDLDFPAVFRELAGLDSVLQAAGRCNREGKHPAEESVVTIFEGVSATPRMLETNIGAAREALQGGADPGDPETVARYFRAFRSLTGTLDKAGVVSGLAEGLQGRTLPFRTVAERFHLIDDAARTVYIPRDEGAELVRRLQNGERSRALFRGLGQYGVSIYDQQYQGMLRSGVLELVDENSAILRDLSLYDAERGLKLSEEQLKLGFLNI